MFGQSRSNFRLNVRYILQWRSFHCRVNVEFQLQAVYWDHPSYESRWKPSSVDVLPELTSRTSIFCGSLQTTPRSISWSKFSRENYQNFPAITSNFLFSGNYVHQKLAKEKGTSNANGPKSVSKWLCNYKSRLPSIHSTSADLTAQPQTLNSKFCSTKSF